MAGRSRIPGWVAVGGLSFVILACALDESGGTNFREDVILCEESVAHLQECCPDLDQVDPDTCEYFSGCGTTTYTRLDEKQSRCVRSKECTELRSEGVCDRARRLLLPTAAELESDESTTQEAVCAR